MQCEICSQNEAVVHFKHVMDGEVRELNICEACAAKNGLSIQPPDLISDFLMGKTAKSALESSARMPVRQCLVCGMKDADFNKLSRLGCSECYEEFESDVERIVSVTQKASRHVGRVPGGGYSSENEAQLRKMMEQAVAAQDFEEAARIRDILERAGQRENDLAVNAAVRTGRNKQGR